MNSHICQGLTLQEIQYYWLCIQISRCYRNPKNVKKEIKKYQNEQCQSPEYTFKYQLTYSLDGTMSSLTYLLCMGFDHQYNAL